MVELLQTYNIADILIVLIISCAALLWLYKSYKFLLKQYDESIEYRKFQQDLPKVINNLAEKSEAQDKAIELLMRSDKARIRGELLKQLEYFKKKGEIDMRSWENLHEIYDIYKEEHGNSWGDEVILEIDQIRRKTI